MCCFSINRCVLSCLFWMLFFTSSWRNLDAPVWLGEQDDQKLFHPLQTFTKKRVSLVYAYIIYWHVLNFWTRSRNQRFMENEEKCSKTVFLNRQQIFVIVLAKCKFKVKVKFRLPQVCARVFNAEWSRESLQTQQSYSTTRRIHTHLCLAEYVQKKLH